MKAYLADVNDIIENGVQKTDRTGTGTLSVVGQSTRFKLKEGHPHVTSRFTSSKAVIDELVWLLRGDTSQRALKASGCNIWNEWADEQGRLGPVYGAMWRRRPAGVVTYKTVEKSLPLAGVNYVDSTKAAGDFNIAHELVEKSKFVNNFIDCFLVRTPLELTKTYTAAYDQWVSLLATVAENPAIVFDASWLNFENFLDDFSLLPGNENAGVRPMAVYIKKCAVNPLRIDRSTLQFVPVEMKGYIQVANDLSDDEKLPPNHYVEPVFYIDQIQEVLNSLLARSDSRRIIVDGWEPSLLPLPGLKPHEQAAQGRQALPPCHTLFQFFVNPPVVEGGKHQLSLVLYQRSKDEMLGAPFNISSYAAMVQLFAKMTGLEADEIVVDAGDCHIYLNHVDTAKEQLKRETFPLPKLEIVGDVSSSAVDLYHLKADQFKLVDYEYGPKMSYPIAV